ncbi:putative metalloendopeptidase [Operophtera brumata]|uniref:Putative metalloendopeptidase n=1 Tax=Operophtera brumata TaxID=104452 RepID=A0A0L7KYZ9_OPEBR|nr:putative metalloendopeptidase [Operophtera brumata]
MYSLFSTQVVLTKEGLNHIDEAIEETNFRFEEESQPADYVENLVENMHFYPPQHYITGDKLYYKYDPKGITDLLECMHADSANIMILSNKHATPIHYDSKEHWMKRWTNVEPYPNFHLPNKNIYITTDFSLIAPAQPYLDAAADLGIDLHNTSMKDIRKKAVESENMKKTLKHGELIAAVENFRLLLVKLITDEMNNCTERMSEGLFEAVREALLVNDISYQEMKEFSARLWDQFYVQALVQGNVPWYEAIRISERIGEISTPWDTACIELLMRGARGQPRGGVPEEVCARREEANREDSLRDQTLSEVKQWVANHFASGNKSMFKKLSVQLLITGKYKMWCLWFQYQTIKNDYILLCFICVLE